MTADQCPVCGITIVHDSAEVHFNCPQCDALFYVKSDGTFTMEYSPPEIAFVNPIESTVTHD